MTWRLAAALLAVAVLPMAAHVLLDGGVDEQRRTSPAPSLTTPREVSRIPRRRATPSRPRGPLGARLLRRVLLRERPGGRVVRALGPRTEYGSQRVLAVVARRGGRLAVLSEELPNSRAGWIPAAGAELLLEPYSVHVDLSARTLLVRRGRRVVRRVAVAIGRPGSTTPTGRFAVTDALRIGHRGSRYGCCALALTGRQPNVPQGWTGGDRLAIHGTTNEASIGTPASSGCLRASDRDMRWLLSRIPLGAPVRIRA